MSLGPLKGQEVNISLNQVNMALWPAKENRIPDSQISTTASWGAGDGRTDGSTGGQTDRRTGWTDSGIDEHVDGQAGRRADRQVGRRGGFIRTRSPHLANLVILF